MSSVLRSMLLNKLGSDFENWFKDTNIGKVATLKLT